MALQPGPDAAVRPRRPPRRRLQDHRHADHHPRQRRRPERQRGQRRDVQQRQEQRPGDASLLHGRRQSQLFRTSSSAARRTTARALRTDNGTTYNQVIGGDGMGAAYSQANTNTVLGSAQGSAHTHEPQQHAAGGLPELGRAGRVGRLGGRRLLHCDRPRARRAGSDRSRVLPLHELARVADQRWRPELDPDRIGRRRHRLPACPPARRFRSSPYNLGVSPTDLNRIARRRRRRVPRHHHERRRELDRYRPDREGARVPGIRHERHLAGQPERSGSPRSRRLPAPIRVIKASIASPADSWATATFVAMQNGLPDLPVTRVYFDPRDADALDALRGHSRRASTARPTAARTGSRTATGCRPFASTTSTCRPTAASCASRPTAAASGSCRRSSS